MDIEGNRKEFKKVHDFCLNKYFGVEKQYIKEQGMFPFINKNGINFDEWIENTDKIL